MSTSKYRILLRLVLRDYGGQVAPAYATLLRQGYGGQEASSRQAHLRQGSERAGPPTPTSYAKATEVKRLRAGRPTYANLLRQGYGGQEASAGKPAYAKASSRQA